MIVGIQDINKSDDYAKLKEALPADYLSDGILKLFSNDLSVAVKAVAIEYPYVDKDYRSTYYNFYSKRHRAYEKFCVRLHLFGKYIGENELERASEDYYGSIVLRPNEVTPLGRTLLSPLAIRDFRGYICETLFDNSLMGIPLSVRCFPHIMQDSDVTVCAHAVCWMIARYYSERYAVYPERLSYDIVTLTKDLSEGRITPSRGLSLGQISEIMGAIGFSPEIFVRDLYSDTSLFYDILYAYVESGIPVVAGLGAKQHAVAVVGHAAVAYPRDVLSNNREKLISARCMIDRLIINDDNYLPYRGVSLNDEGGCIHTITDIDCFVVPLYEKMYLSAENVFQLYRNIFKLLNISLDDQYIVRVFMTSSRSYKKALRAMKLLPDSMLRAQLELAMPKFIWVVEVASPSNYAIMRTDLRWIIDATANQYEMYPFLFVHDREKMLIHDRALKSRLFRVNFDASNTGYEMYEHNLRRYT